MNNLEEILKSARQLDQSALADLTQNFYPVIFRYFFYRTRTREDAEDLTSEVFVRLVKSIKNQKGNFAAWLFRIARNLLVDHYRKTAKSKMTSLDQIDAEFLVSLNEDKKAVLQADDIKLMLTHLTEDQKEIITLKFIEGYSNGEIAQILKKSIGAVKVMQFRALSRLRKILKRESYL